jgi:hypothetical protein
VDVCSICVCGVFAVEEPVGAAVEGGAGCSTGAGLGGFTALTIALGAFATSLTTLLTVFTTFLGIDTTFFTIFFGLPHILTTLNL